MATNPPLPKPVDRGMYFFVVAFGVIVVVLLALVVMTNGQALDTSKASSAAGVLALVTALAVGIERVLEAFWTLIDRLVKNPSYPFSSDAKLLDNLANALGENIKDPLVTLDTFLKKGDAAATALQAQRPQLSGDLAKLLASVNDVLNGQKDPKSFQRLNALQAGLADINRQVGSTQTGANLGLAVEALDAMYGWVDTLLLNPGRKLMSIFAGALVGLVVAWAFGLDLVHAALTVAPPSGWAWGIAVTGVVVGLGSNPTHELIHAIQSYKQSAQP